jgi:hypothetical protein
VTGAAADRASKGSCALLAQAHWALKGGVMQAGELTVRAKHMLT